jgi:1,4-dihydroxy-2-naphthoate octaprenyltransferase
VLLTWLALPAASRMWRVYQRPAPQQCPADYPASVWPLWFAAFAFVHARQFATLGCIGLLLGWALRHGGAA